jgi:PilZ domain
MMPHERRLNTRKPLDQLAYLSLPPNNGGIVLDVSEGGLGFHAIAPVDASGPIEFKFEIDSDRKITAAGELAWKDSTGKSGGLRFTQLADETRLQIRQWAEETALKQAAQVAARAIAKVISTAFEVSEFVPPNGDRTEPNGNTDSAQVAKTPPAEAVATSAVFRGTNGNPKLSGDPKVSVALAATANPSLSGKPEVARVVNAAAVAAPSATGLLGGANGKVEAACDVPTAVTTPAEATDLTPNVNPMESESAIAAALEAVTADASPIDLGIDWVREANVLVSARAAGVDPPVIPTPEPAHTFTSASPSHVSRTDVLPSAPANPPPGPAQKTQLLYNRKPPIYSSPAYEFSMFTPEAIDDATAPIPTMLGALESAIAKHPLAAVGLTAALALLVSIGIFSYLCAGPVGDAFANSGEKIWGGMYSHQMPANPGTPAPSTGPAKAVQQ